MPAVIFDPNRRAWLLSTPATSYALRLDADDVPRHVHWGPRLTPEAAATVPAGGSAATDGFEGFTDADAELVTAGGAGYDAPSLRVAFADGTGAVEWRYLDQTIDGGHLRVRLADRHYPLEATLHYRVYEDSDVIERWLELAHTGDGEPIVVHRADSASWRVPVRAGYRLSHVVGGWAREFQLERSALPLGETVLTSRRGITSHHANPWLMLDAGDAGEDCGEVWSAALAWSGSWTITVRHRETGRASFTTGFGHDGFRWRLRPGERLVTPPSLGLYSAGGFGAASRAWHAHVRGHVLPLPEEHRPVLYNSWEATGFDVDEDNQKRLAARAAALGVELFVMDDGWFGARTDDHAGLGDWTPNPDRFPAGLDPLIAQVHRLGMRFGLWVEPEMVNPDSDLYRAHPDWVLHMPHRRRTTLRHQLVLNFARPDVAQWAHTWLDRLVGDHAVDFLKWDMNRAFSEAGWPDAGEDADRLWVDHVRGVYHLIDRLRADHPNLRIESCSGGGGRIDLGILSRVDEVWTSDNTDAADRVEIQYGYSQLYPSRAMAAWVTDSPNPFTGRLVPLRFRLHVAMSGVLGIGGNLLEWTEAELRETAEAISLYKEIRPVVQHGVLHRLGREAVQYTAGDRVVVFAWRRNVRFGRAVAPLRLAALDPDARYRDEDTGAVHYGAVLLSHGLALELSGGDYASAVIRLARV